MLLKKALALISVLTCVIAQKAQALDIAVEEPSNANFASIVLTNTIIKGDAAKFKNAVLGVIRRNKPVMAIRTYSPGGSLYDGMEIGRMVRTMRANTYAPNYAPGSSENRTCYAEQFGGEFTYNPRTRAGNSRCECASACFIIWAAGWARRGAVLGVHRMRFSDIADSSPATAQERYARAMAQMKSYLQEMGIPDDIINKNLTTGSDSLHYLTQQELQPIVGLAPSTYELVVGRCGAAEARAGSGRCLDTVSWQEILYGMTQFTAKYRP